MSRYNYVRELKVWLPDAEKERLQRRYGIRLLRSASTRFGEEGQWVTVMEPEQISSGLALLLDVELSTYITD